MPAASLRALLAGSIDYAGFFPPASLELEPALRNYAQYLHARESWMLNAFVLPVKKFVDATADLSAFGKNPLCISALGPKTENAKQFIEELAAAAETIRKFQAKHSAPLKIAQIEMELPLSAGASLADTNKALAGLEIPIFWETGVDDAERMIGFISEHRRTGAGRFGFKLRTGGVIASAFPSSVQIARTLVAATSSQVPLKFTAGLHHPIRKFNSSVQTKMHGFLNVLGAGVLAAEHGWSQQQTSAMLEDEDASSFVFDDAAFSWREWKVATDRIKAHRAFITSFGSCSFDEPRDDLRELQLLA
ncbi:MAG: hypothetical protein ACXWAV_06635 [Chthoniobacterales bacterium]